MELKPVRCYKEPKYAAYEFLLDHPELLNRVPERWRGNKLVLVAAGTLATFISSCTWNGGRTGGSPLPTPVITESEAQTIIRDEAAKAGLTFISNSLTIDSIRIPLHLYSDTTTTDTVRYTPAINFTFDGHDTTHHVTYEYISENDISGWRNLDSIAANVIIDSWKTARDFQNELRNQHSDLHVGVFHESDNETELREQVQEFVAWLRTEGII